MNYELLLLLAGISSFFFILLYIFKLKPDLEVEIARAKIFDLRYRWFDLASSGKVDRESEVYRKVESDLNLVLRHMHRITFSNILAVAITERIYGSSRAGSTSPVKTMLSSIKSIELKQEVMNIYVESAQAMLVCLINRSVFLQTIANIAVFGFKLSARLRNKNIEDVAVNSQSVNAESDINVPGSSQVVYRVKNSLKNKAKVELIFEEVLMKAEAA